MTDDRDRLARNLAARGYLLDVDPLRPPETDGILPAADYVTGYDAGFRDAEHLRPRLVQTTAFGCGVIVGMLLAIVLAYAALAAPRSGADPTTPQPGAPASIGSVDVSARVTAGTSGPGQSGAPLPPVSVVSAPLPVPTASSAAGEPIPATSRGNIGWAVPSLGSRYLAIRAPRGTVVRICAATCVTLPSTDYGPSSKIRPARIADLAVGLWSKVCAKPPRDGLCRATITVVGGIDVPSTSRPTAPPTDVQR